jgi:hypothetical protein
VSPRTAAVVALGLGALAVVAATLVGQDPARLDAIVKPPALIRAVLVGVAAVLGVTCLARGLTRLSAGTTDAPGLVRGVRYLFLAVAAAAAAAGWLLGEALPLVIALVIAGVDVVETSLLLIVVGSGSVSREG